MRSGSAREMFETVDLEPMVLPETAGLRRRSAISKKAQKPDFAEKYDWWTLVYGAAPVRGGLVLVCPKLLNLKALVKAGRFSCGGAAMKLRWIRPFRRHDEVWLSGEVAGDELVFEREGLRLACPVRGSWEGFARRRCLVTTSKDNELDWIEDWVAHHVRHQGTEAVLLHDNLSTLYAPGEILDRLRGIAGLKAARVVSVPCRYGPLGTKPPRGLGKFLQGGLLNLARHGALAGARSVLQCDIDEIALSDPGAPTLHEAAEAGRLGYATAPAVWRDAEMPEAGPAHHRDHVLAWQPERTSKEKWAVVPGGPLGWMGWDVHGIGGYFLNDFVTARGVRFFHCERLSTDWKRPRAEGNGKVGAVFDPASAEALERAGTR